QGVQRRPVGRDRPRVRLRAALPADRRGEEGRQGPQAAQGAALGGGADDRLAEPLPRDHHPLREEGGELLGGRAVRVRVALVPPPTPAHDLRWFLSLDPREWFATRPRSRRNTR